MTQQTLANEAVTAADAADGYESTYQRHSHRVVYSTVGLLRRIVDWKP